MDDSGDMHLSFYNGTDSSGSLQYATGADRRGPPLRSMTARRWSGTYSDIALDGNGNPHISYVDSTNGLLRYAHHDGSSWSLSTVDPSGSVIGHTSIAVDDDGNPRISYHDGALRLAEWDGVIVDPDHPGLRVSRAGHPDRCRRDGKTRIAYFDEDKDDLFFSLAGHQSPA